MMNKKKWIHLTMAIGVLLLVNLLMNVATATPYATEKKNNYNVRDYGAKGDGTNLDTKAINKTIAAASANGGGTVYFPAGNYLTGSIRLQSNITLYIDNGAVIQAADVTSDSAEYDSPEKPINDQYQDYGHSHFHNSLIWGEKLHDIAIIGSGMIWGKGLVRSGHKGDNRANKSISLLLCRNVLIRDIRIKHGGWFGILATGVDNFTIDNVTMDTNRDGMDIDCCHNVRISNCMINSPFDDGICLKSSFALGFARSTENVTITNCQVSGYDEGTLLDGTFKREYTKYSDGTTTGRIKLGTESNGGFKNIAITNCVFDYSRGLALETVDGALLEDVTINNITMRDIVNAPIFIRLGARMRAPDSMKVGECRRIMISHMNVYNADPRFGCIISGIPGHDIEDLQMSDISIYYKGGGNSVPANIEVPEYEKDYPEPYRFKTIPSYGFFIRHVNGLKLNNVMVSFLKEDTRPAYILDQASHVEFNFVNGQTIKDVPRLVIKNSDDIELFKSFGIADKNMGRITKESIR